jgi:hypothetical protein
MALRSGRTTRWTPAAIPVGMLLMLLGAWAFFVPLVGPSFRFGFLTSDSWAFGNGDDWKLTMFAGIAIFVAGLTLTMPSSGLGSLGALLGFAGGAWLLVGPSLYPALGGRTVMPLPHSEWMTALLWVGYFYGTGALTMYFTGAAHGLFARRPVVEEMPVIEETPVPVERTETTTVTHA